MRNRKAIQNLCEETTGHKLYVVKKLSSQWDMDSDDRRDKLVTTCRFRCSICGRKKEYNDGQYQSPEIRDAISAFLKQWEENKTPIFVKGSE